MGHNGESPTGAQQTYMVSWMPFHGRNRGLSEELGMEILDLRTRIPDRIWTSPLSWLWLSIKTVRHLRAVQPAAVMVTNPPVFNMAVTVYYARNRFPVVVDIHHGPFEEPRWKWSLPWTIRLAKKCALAIVTNPTHQKMLEAEGIPSVILHNAPIAWDAVPAEECDDHVFAPLSYRPDEPVDQLLEAAAALPDTPFKLTGRAPAEVQARATDNVEFVGYISDEEYTRLLSRSAAVVCFTDKPNTMQQGGYEALAAGRPFVTSESDVLRDYFGAAATYADPGNADSIREAIQTALSERVAMSKAMAQLCSDYRETYQVGLEPVRAAMAGVPVPQGGGAS